MFSLWPNVVETRRSANMDFPAGEILIVGWVVFKPEVGFQICLARGYNYFLMHILLFLIYLQY